MSDREVKERAPAPAQHSARFAARSRARRRARLRAAGVGLLALALLAGAIWAVAFSSLLAVRDVSVAGVSRLSVGEVERAAAVPAGGSLVLLDTAAIAARVRALPPVAKVSVRRGLPHSVRIVVTERTATTVVRTPAGLWLADAEGVRFATVGEVPDGLPVVRTDSDDPPAAILARAARLLEALPGRVRKLVVEVRADAADDMSVELRGDRKVVWGGAEQAELKARVLEVLFGRKARVYDVSVPEAPVTRK